MKPVAPALSKDEARNELPSLQSEIRDLCDQKAAERITIPAPPSVDILRLATPLPPAEHAHPDTIPAPPPSSARRPVQRDEREEEDEAVPSTIPGPPRVPSIAV
jgi:hypothetical protein